MNRAEFFAVNASSATKPRLMIYIPGADFVSLTLPQFARLPSMAFILNGIEWRLSGSSVHPA